MKMKVWKKCMFIIGVPLLVITSLCANNEIPDNSVKKTRSSTFIYEKDKAWEPAGEGVTRQIMGYDGQLMLVKVKFEKGAIGTPHTHYHTQTTYVATGKFEFTVGDEKKIVEAGDGIYIEPDILHGCICLEPRVLIDCFAPMRADFLK
ncbi:cupin domain-containing protein [Bacteroides sp. CR5/BHMF/2]|nr:cupin domain-containing protein [Bacteroides sp. CR5/BHMF/2]